MSGDREISMAPQSASPLHWYLEPWRKYAVFSGRAGWKECWYFFLFNLIILFMLGVIEVLGIIASIYQLALLIPSISVGVRRMHDTNHSGWCLLLPVVNVIFLATGGQQGDNRFGPDPMPGVRRLRKIWAWAAGAVAAAGLALAGGGWLFARYVTGGMEALNIWVEDIATGQARPLTAGGKTNWPRFSSDGSKLLYVRMADGTPTSFVIHELDGGNETVVLEEQGAFTPDWGPGDASLVYTFRPESGDKDLWVLDLASGGKRRLTSDPAEENAPQVSPDGQWVLFEQDADGAADELFVIPFAGGEKRRLTFTDGYLQSLQKPPGAFTWASEDEIAYVDEFLNLVFGGVDGKVTQEISLAGFTNLLDLSRDPTAPGVLMFRASNVGVDGGFSVQHIWYRLSYDTEELEVFREGLSLFQMDNRISPDGKLLAYTK